MSSTNTSTNFRVVDNPAPEPVVFDHTTTTYEHPNIMIKFHDGRSHYDFTISEKAANAIWLALGQILDKKFEI